MKSLNIDSNWSWIFIAINIINFVDFSARLGTCQVSKTGSMMMRAQQLMSPKIETANLKRVKCTIGNNSKMRWGTVGRGRPAKQLGKVLRFFFRIYLAEREIEFPEKLEPNEREDTAENCFAVRREHFFSTSLASCWNMNDCCTSIIA